jgi:hypothetical protein
LIPVITISEAIGLALPSEFILLILSILLPVFLRERGIVFMQVKISNIEFDVENSQSGVEELFARIDEAMKDFGVYFSHLVVDGVEITDPHHDYVVENLADIGGVEVIFLTQEQHLVQVMGIMDAFLKNALPSLKAVADEFYGKPDDDTWSRFDACINGITSLLGIINSLVTNPELEGKTAAFGALGASIGLHLENLLTAARLNDYTLMADILYFELVKFLEELREAVTKLVGSQNNATH